MIGGVGLNEGVLPTKPPSALPMHMNNHVLELHGVTCAPVRLKTWFFFQIKVYSLILQEISNSLFGNLTFPPTVKLHATKRQELYTKSLAQTVQIDDVDI